MNDIGAPSASKPQTHNPYFTACFRSVRPQTLGNNIAAVMEQIANDAAFAVRNTPAGDAEAIATFVPFLLCGEESAVHVFHREARRVRSQDVAAQALMMRIAGEEKVHEAMLARLARELPEPKCLEATRLSGHEFYIGMADSNPGIHFARIAALDSCVSKIMAALCSAARIIRVPAVHRVFARVRSDEASHVRISRQHVTDLGHPRTVLNEEADRVCPRLANFIQPTGDAFEYLGIDPDRLFRRIRREEV